MDFFHISASLNHFHVERVHVLFFDIAYLSISLHLAFFVFSFCLCFDYCCSLLLKSALERTSLEYRFLSSIELFPQDEILEVDQSIWTFYDSCVPAAFQRFV